MMDALKALTLRNNLKHAEEMLRKAEAQADRDESYIRELRSLVAEYRRKLRSLDR